VWGITAQPPFSTNATLIPGADFLSTVKLRAASACLELVGSQRHDRSDNPLVVGLAPRPLRVCERPLAPAEADDESCDCDDGDAVPEPDSDSPRRRTEFCMTRPPT
jgi:hypothetical protein